MRIGFAAGLFVTLACACQDLHAPPTGDRAGAKVSATAPAPAPAGTALTPAPAPPPAAAAEAETLPWIHDDYAAALADAKKRNLPVAIDMWAPWCHTCLSMQATVLADQSFAPLADRFVWLSIDTDKPQNAAVLEKFPVAMWPTFYVVSPAAEAIEARHLGA
ncbi:MAG TPA: thioredoxin family protein, partial [Kofleriaceae bacterium]|nr:thioredoxin family protein [Kofleriaceae bacterium]